MTCRVIYDSAEALRVEGNELFKQGNLEDAAACWRQALAKIAEAPDSERLDGPEADNLSKCESACISNISLYHFQQGDWQSCIKWCDIVLTGGDNLKARFRRAQVSLGQSVGYPVAELLPTPMVAGSLAAGELSSSSNRPRGCTVDGPR